MAQLLNTTITGSLTTTGLIAEGGVSLPLKYIRSATAQIGTVGPGTPSVTVSIDNTTGAAAFTFNNLKGAKGASISYTALPYSVTFSDGTTTSGNLCRAS